jgi:glycosyltransferase involved in cell wall biosynthesis
MRILYIAQGNSTHTRRWVTYFADRGYQIMLISFYPAESIKGVELVHIPVKNKNFAIFKANAVKRLINQFKPNILHAHYATSCGIVAALTGFHPYILSTWGDDIFDFPNKSLLHRWLVQKAIRSADYLTATSEMLARGTRELAVPDKQIEVIPFGVDLEHYRYHERTLSEDVHIGTVRALRPKYGLEYLIRAVAELLNSGKKVKLTIVGEGYLRSELESLAITLGIGDSIRFAGFVQNEQVEDFLNDFDIFAMPSVGKGETFGVAAVEAMATGLPVVASRVGGLPEVVKHDETGLLVEPGNVKQLAHALKQYIDNPHQRFNHGINGRRRVEAKYDWLDNAGLMESLYHKIYDERT